MKKLIFGHKNPDLDSIASAIVWEKYCKKMGIEAEALRLGNVNKETKYVLEYLGIETPRMLEKVAQDDVVILVDHNEFSQSVEGIKTAKIESVIDHHRIYDFETADPIFYYAEPLGCTCSVMYKLYKANDVQIEKEEATLMLSAIISDTLLFKSPTCTEFDIKVANELAKIAEIDIQTYGIELLKAGMDLSDVSADELIKLDAKEVMLNDVKAVIAQVNTASIEEMLTRKEEIENAINKMLEEDNLDVFLFAITDIINCNSQAIVLGRKTDLVEKAFDVKLENNTAFLSGVVSRKKQILPVLTKNA